MTSGASQPARKRAPRGQARAKVLEAAGDLFAEQGVSGTSLQSIADRMGITKAAVYHQFTSKDELVLAVAAPVIELLRAIADAAAGHDEESARAIIISGLVELVLEQRSNAALTQRDPTMSKLLDADPAYRVQIARIDAGLLGTHPTPERLIALAFVGGGIMAVGSQQGFDGPPAQVRAGLIAAMTRALDA